MHAVLLASLLAAQPSGAQARFYLVDLERVMRESNDGKDAKARLMATHDTTQAELDRKQNELREAMAAAKTPEEQQRVQARFAELQQAFTKDQERLNEAERKMVQTLTARLADALAPARAAVKPGAIFERQLADFVNLPEPCELTPQLTKAFDAGATLPAPDDPRCTFDRAAVADVQRVLQESKAGKAEIAKLKAALAKRQAGIDAESNRIKAMPDGPDKQRAFAALQQRFTRESTESSAAEKAATDALLATARARMRAKAPARTLVGLGPAPTPSPACDATPWAIALLDGARPPADVCGR